MARRLAIPLAVSILLAVSVTAVGCATRKASEDFSKPGESGLSRSTRFLLSQFEADKEGLDRTTSQIVESTKRDAEATAKNLRNAPGWIARDFEEGNERNARTISAISRHIAEDFATFPDDFRRFLQLIL